MDPSRGYREAQLCPTSASLPYPSHPLHIPARKDSFLEEAIPATRKNGRNEDGDPRSPHAPVLFLLDTGGHDRNSWCSCGSGQDWGGQLEKRLAVGIGSYSRDDGAGRSDLPVMVPVASKPEAVLKTVTTLELRQQQ